MYRFRRSEYSLCSEYFCIEVNMFSFVLPCSQPLADVQAISYLLTTVWQLAQLAISELLITSS
jgi:hypothetical protein